MLNKAINQLASILLGYIILLCLSFREPSPQVVVTANIKTLFPDKDIFLVRLQNQSANYSL